MFTALRLFVGTTFSAYKVYFILAGIALLVGTTAYLMWSYKDAMADRAVQQAVDKTTKEAQGKIDAAEKQAAFYRDLADKKYSALMDKISKIKVQRTEITNNIREEVAAHPNFYRQPLPEKGWEQWKKARRLYPDASSQEK